MAEPIVEYTIRIDANGDVTNDTQAYDSTFAQVYWAFHRIKQEVDRQIAERRACPFNPIHGGAPDFTEKDAPCPR